MRTNLKDSLGRTTITLALMLAMVGPLQSQDVAAPRQRPPLPRAMIGGLLGVGASLGAGAAAYLLAGGGRVCGDDPCGLPAGLVVGALSEVILLPLGVHLGDNRAGNLGLTLLASTGAGVISAAVGGFDPDGGFVIIVPVSQFLAALVAERASHR